MNGTWHAPIFPAPQVVLLTPLWPPNSHAVTPTHGHSHIHIAQVAVQVFNDVRVLAAVEDGQGPRVALVPHISICWVYGDGSEMHQQVANKDGPHALAQQVKDSLYTLQAEVPT